MLCGLASLVPTLRYATHPPNDREPEQQAARTGWTRDQEPGLPTPSGKPSPLYNIPSNKVHPV
ncbi:uncharacterized protein H6S33_001492 [Morchella sextelata]|uniref:uncharacterized protein n=1 Tax=Morchella sextelata TaxID=1174677 RepID=UPI001D04B886|nr:uncharacterized protein H6S33_001492 [Morchella sextelata]KAH0608358.1 hypothetical protein H6S33_001492 [Morchella sextelata]